MQKLGLVVLMMCGVACGGVSKEQAQRDVDALIVLYNENRPKFVVQKQEIEQGDCGRATALREVMDDKAKAAAMSPDDTQVITMVQMELSQAEKTCLSR